MVPKRFASAVSATCEFSTGKFDDRHDGIYMYMHNIYRYVFFEYGLRAAHLDQDIARSTSEFLLVFFVLWAVAGCLGLAKRRLKSGSCTGLKRGRT